MIKEEELDWLYRLKSEIYVYMPAEWITPMNNALDAAIKSLEQLPELQNINDCISRAAAIEGVETWSGGWIEYIKSLPSVTLQESKTGHWIVDGSVDCYLDKVRCHCSECGKKKEFPADYDHIKQELSISYKYSEVIDNFCPNCGARMTER